MFQFTRTNIVPSFYEREPQFFVALYTRTVRSSEAKPEIQLVIVQVSYVSDVTKTAQTHAVL